LHLYFNFKPNVLVEIIYCKYTQMTMTESSHKKLDMPV
jgi:hypothetical protein